MKRITEKKISNFITVRFANDATTEPVEILIYDEIGKDPWSGNGISASDFSQALNQIPAKRDLNIRINSRGGDVWEGMAIKSLIDQYPGKVKGIVDGIAASTASWICMGCDEIEMSGNAQMFIHDAWGICMGNADDMSKSAEQLDQTSNQIAGFYAEKTGKSVDAMRQMMRDETLMTGADAKAMGMIDTLNSKAAISNFTNKDLAAMKDKLASSRNSTAGNTPPKPAKTAPQSENIMKREQLIAMLNKFGVKFDKDANDDALVALVNAIPAPTAPAKTEPATPVSDPKIIELENRVKQLTEADNAAKKLRITNVIETCIAEDRLPATMKDQAIERAMKDETILPEYNALPAKPPGALPVAGNVELTGESIADVQKFVLENGPKMMRNFIGGRTNGDLGPQVIKDIHNRAVRVANVVKQHRNKIISMWNANVIDADLQRTVIMQDLLRAYAIRLLPLTAFCKSFTNVPLEGTDKVTVPYFPLQTQASTNWDPAVGYAAAAGTVENARTVQINKRKFQQMLFSSSELRRQPYQNWQQLAAMNAEKLGVDVNADVLSVITAANFGASVKAVPAAAFSGDDVSDLYGTATDANWPDTGRSLILTTGYKVALLKDPGFKYALNYGTDDAIRRADIKSAYGFEDIYTVPTANLPANGENLVGFITHMSAVLLATAPIMPAPAVRALMVQYDLAVDPDLGVALEYKLFGNTVLDQTNEVVEANYGYITGVASALKRMTSS